MPLRVISFKMDENLLTKLDKLAKATGMSRSELIRHAIELMLKKEEYKEKVGNISNFFVQGKLMNEIVVGDG